jgi:hypothetical protein
MSYSLAYTHEHTPICLPQSSHRAEKKRSCKNGSCEKSNVDVILFVCVATSLSLFLAPLPIFVFGTADRDYFLCDSYVILNFFLLEIGLVVNTERERKRKIPMTKILWERKKAKTVPESNFSNHYHHVRPVGRRAISRMKRKIPLPISSLPAPDKRKRIKKTHDGHINTHPYPKIKLPSDSNKSPSTTEFLF